MKCVLFVVMGLLMMLAPPTRADTPLPRVSSGHIERLANFRSRYIAPRHVDIWLPASYDGKTPHAVLYMHDGQMLFDATTTWNHQEWRADETASALIAEHRMRPFIIVGIWNGGDARHVEYFPQKPFESLTPEQQAAQYALRRDAERPLFIGKIDSDDYLKFLVTELKPFIDRHYTVATDRDNTFIMGSSMGGLISLYALSEYPNVFGGAACLSTHWPGSFAPDNNPLPAAFFAYLETHLPRADKHRLYFDRGTETLDSTYAELQARADALIAAKGYGAKDSMSLTFPGDEHSEKAWAGRLALPLRFLLGEATAAAAGLVDSVSKSSDANR